ncbi:MAG: tryptophan synthase subunit beta [Clostridiales bacterium]|nr:tryptophan synthase subunit beta [Clostridiales bacterium]
MTGKFGIYGGQYVSELLMKPLKELEDLFESVKTDTEFHKEYDNLLANYVGRSTPLYYAENLTKKLGGAKIYLKREDLNHTGAHKINNAIGQALLARRIGKQHIIAETGAGQHGVATATACALLELKCTVFMGEEDIKRQSSNVERMRILGASIISVSSGSKVLKDATNEAIRYWIEHIDTAHYIIGSAIGPHPYPTMVKYFQSIIGRETKQQYKLYSSKPPTKIIACVGGGSNAIGMFAPFIGGKSELIGVEAAGKGIDTPFHASTLTKGKLGVLHGSMMYLLQENGGNITEVYSISAGLDYPGIGPEHCYLKDEKLVRYESITDLEAVSAFKVLCQLEGIIPALESSHALAQCIKEAPEMSNDESVIVCLSGRGDKDLNTILNMEESHDKY